MSIHAAPALAILCLSGCGGKPVVVSADTSCERFRHVSATDAERAAMRADWGLWEALAVQIASHNTEFDKACLAPKAGP